MSPKSKTLLPPLLIIIITILASLICVFQIQAIHFENQVNDLSTQLHTLQNPTYNVTIENITSTSWEFLAGMSMDKFYTISIKNVGLNDVGGLTFEFKILNNGTVWNSSDYRVRMISPGQLGVLHAGESTTIQADISSSIGVSFTGKTFVATVIWDKTVLDELTVAL